MPVRCVNIDWLEVHCLEPVNQPHDADYFRAVGFSVVERAYGTRVYNQMFTLLDGEGDPTIEIRREPKSTGLKGIHSNNECHIRLRNRECYRDDAASYLQRFIETYGYEFRRISRIDVCCDFERFDYGDSPGKFIDRYMRGKYAKINQSDITSHGSDLWDGRTWTSLSWGSKKSCISTKLYLKTKELKEVGDKPHIRYVWYRAGLVEDPVNLTRHDKDGNIYNPDIWRLEFSIKSTVRNWYDIYPEGDKNGHHSYPNTLSVYDDRAKLWKVFISLAEHYFHFRKFERGKTKYNCDRKLLFNTDDVNTYMHVHKLPSEDSTHEKALLFLRIKLEQYANITLNNKNRSLAIELASLLNDDIMKEFGSQVFTKDEILALQLAISSKKRNPDIQSICNHISRIKDMFTGEIW